MHKNHLVVGRCTHGEYGIELLMTLQSLFARADLLSSFSCGGEMAPWLKKANLANAVSCSVCPSGEVPRTFPGQQCVHETLL